jgi:hypothetical protein
VDKTVVLEGHKVTSNETLKALSDLIANKKLSTRQQGNILKSLGKMEGFDAVAKGSIDKAEKAATHDSKTIKAYRNWIAWLFAFGLIGLGMQITGKALKQAGGAPLIIGSVVGTAKAVGSLIVVLMFVKEFV